MIGKTDMTNEEVWRQWKSGEEEFDVLYNRFIGDVRTLAYKYHGTYGKKFKMEFGDWESLGGFAIFDACSKYQEGYNNKLGSYVFGRILLEFNKVLYVNSYQKNDTTGFMFLELDKPLTDCTQDSLKDLIADNTSQKGYEEIEVFDLCDYYSGGNALLKEVYQDLVLDVPMTVIARKHNINYTTLLRRVNINNERIRRKRDKQ